MAFKTKKLKARVTATVSVFAGASHYSLALSEKEFLTALISHTCATRADLI